MRAVRENQLAAEVTGVNTLMVKAAAFTLSASLAGIAGGLFAAGFAYISPDNFNFARSIEFLTMGLLGVAVMRLSDRVIAMESGRVLADGPPDVVRHDPLVVESYLGGDLSAIERSTHARAPKKPAAGSR